MSTSPFPNVSVNQKFVDAGANSLAETLQTCLQRYCAGWSLFWGLPIQNAAGVAVNAGILGAPQQFPTLALPARLTALAGRVIPSLEAAQLLKTAIESSVALHIAADEVPSPGTPLAFLIPFIDGNTFTLPGTPTGYLITPASDGIGWTLTTTVNGTSVVLATYTAPTT